MDEIFEYDNFENEIIWCYKDVGGGRNTPYYKKKHDTILWYSKTQNYQANEIARGNLSESTIKVYGKHFEDGKLTYRKLQEVYPKTFETRMKQGRVPKDIDEIWLNVSSGKQLEDWWIDINPLRIRKQGSKLKDAYLYSTQKPKPLLERIIKTGSNENDIVADFFMGSGTTGEVALQLGRKFIGCDIGDRACQITEERIEKIT